MAFCLLDLHSAVRDGIAISVMFFDNSKQMKVTLKEGFSEGAAV